MLPLFRLHFWEPVFFNAGDASFSSDSPEHKGRFVRISENIGHDVTFKILNISTNKIINRSNVTPANDNELP